MVRRAVVCYLLFALAAPGMLIAQQRWERQVRERLDRAIAAFHVADPGSVVTRAGVLDQEESASFELMLTEGRPYTIVGVCDDDCTRLQLTLVTSTGNELGKDRNSESLPALHFTPPRTMTYGVRVVIEGCRWNPCWYAVAVVPVRAGSPAQ